MTVFRAFNIAHLRTVTVRKSDVRSPDHGCRNARVWLFLPRDPNRILLRRFLRESGVWKCNRHRSRCRFSCQRAHIPSFSWLWWVSDRPFPVASPSSCLHDGFSSKNGTPFAFLSTVQRPHEREYLDPSIARSTWNNCQTWNWRHSIRSTLRWVIF